MKSTRATVGFWTF